ncbi:MAG TPA: hypothetical protein VIT43_02735 [Candidatus Dormibacteraeota bacterium]
MNRQDVWPSAVVALALLFLVTAITIAAIARYSVDDALKIWNGLTAIVGVITGAFVSYFFTRGTVQQAISQVSKAQDEANSARNDANSAQLDARRSKAALLRMAGGIEPRQFAELVSKDEVVKAALGDQATDAMAGSAPKKTTNGSSR